MGSRINAAVRFALHRLRVHPLAHKLALDPNSIEYLYLVQQTRRLSLATSMAKLRPKNILVLPVVLPIVIVKAIDLWITNQIIQSLINERDLLERSLQSDRRDR